ncbi:exonuclease (plasmid) [Azospirillum sp. B510]|uniref:exonuclease SbcCD subunit D C-terminal domain-containing protein n=1 Tax=Azospirillum sp. (strain B510) TaxID=137722 RepID=UPI0001C4BC17|nr:exonuclease SbcCD subunit D C-terminal domain-containing protein [Azospirillum sp. B510]BAI73991.1 exonuclease [Azospirillum sp. B510]
MRSFRLLHTADWHLGQTLHGIPRDAEHQHFLDWLIDRIGEHRVDALVIAGDIFDGQNPPIPALVLFYRFVARVKALHPGLDIVVVAGNHDSASRLEAPSPLMTEMGVRVVGTLPVSQTGGFDPSPLIVPLRDADGKVAARCVAMPYLRPSDLPPSDPRTVEEETVDPLIEGVRRRYSQAWTAGRERCGREEALILTGHCYMRGGALSEVSERKILGGNLHALPVDIFPEEAAYVALGHLHRAQAVGGRETVRYSGSPIPLALDEEPYPHQVVLAEFAAGRLVGQQPLRVPRHVAIHRVDAASPEEALARLRRLQLDDSLPRDAWPFLEVTVTLPEPRPALRDEVEALLAGRPVRLLKLAVRLTGSGQTLADDAPPVDLASLEPEEVFRRLYRRSHDGAPDADLLAAFHELLTSVQETM